MKGPYFLLVLLVEIAVTTCNQVDVQQANSAEGIVDLTSEDPIVISWDSTAFGPNITHLAVTFHILDSSDQDPMSVDGVNLVVIEKADRFSTIAPAIYKLFEGRVGNEFDATFSVWPVILSDCKKIIIQKASTFLFGKVIRFFLCRGLLPCATYRDILTNNVPGDVGPCPCTTNEARADTKFEESNTAISFFHPGASSCFRSAEPTGTGSGQQCCYGSDGMLLVGPPGGGTADRFSPKDSWLKHFIYDVLPWYGCCSCSKIDADCRIYYDNRPSDNCGGP